MKKSLLIIILLLFSLSACASRAPDSDALAASYDEGYTAGYNAGYSEGSEEGYSDGYNDGEKSAQQPSYEAGFAAGRDQGYADGFSAGYEQGKEISGILGEEQHTSVTEKTDPLPEQTKSTEKEDSSPVKSSEPSDTHAGSTSPAETKYILNTNTKKFHYPYCSSVDQMKDKNKKEYNGTREDVISMGYEPCKRCNP